MNIKRILSITLAAAMLAASGSVFAEEAVPEDIMLISANPAEYDKVELFGTASVKEDGLYIIDTADMPEVQLNTDENTIFVGADGYGSALEAVEDGASLMVVASPAMTRSIPPQTYAYVVITADENGGFPIYAEVSSVEKDENDNTVISSADGKYKIVYSEETATIKPFATKNIVKIDDVTVGTRLLVSSEIMTMSIPAIVPAESIVILPEITEAEDTEESIPEKVILNGKEMSADEFAAQIINRDGAFLFPVRVLCEAAGLNVAWNAENRAITVSSASSSVNFKIGVNSYAKKDGGELALSSAPILENDLTYVPVDFFSQLLNAETETVDGIISITIK